MTDADYAKDDTLIKKRKKRFFPDGTKLSSYNKCSSWSSRRWAWEFLCRNQAFIDECERVADGSAKEKSEVAHKFGLVKFKHYADILGKRFGYPTFKDAAIRSWKNLSSIESQNFKRSFNITPGQVVIRFKLYSTVAENISVASQLKAAEKLLKKSLTEFRLRNTKTNDEDKPKEFKTTEFISILRILDMKLRRNLSSKQIATILYSVTPGSQQEINFDSILRSTRRKIAKAKLYPTDHYMLIALLNKPRKSNPKNTVNINQLNEAAITEGDKTAGHPPAI